MSQNWDQAVFDLTLAEYMKVTSRAVESVINTKSFYIARRAVLETARTPVAAINRFLSWKDGQVIGKMINARRGRRHERGLYGAEMTLAIGLVKAARRRSRAFMASGWISSIKTLEPHAEKIGGGPRRDNTAKQVGQAKGYGIPAHESQQITQAIIVNMAAAKWDKGGQADKGQGALQRAFDTEVRSMIDYLRQRLAPDAEAWNRLQRS